MWMPRMLVLGLSEAKARGGGVQIQLKRIKHPAKIVREM